MKILVLGASRGTGALCVKSGLAKGAPLEDRGTCEKTGATSVIDTSVANGKARMTSICVARSATEK